MARKLRLQYPNAVYHIMSRGNRKGLIFLDDKDRFRFMDTLEEVCERTGFRIHSYVLMPNHYHLLLETPEANLVAGMHWLQTTYTIRFNLRHKLVGHLFQGRYKAIPVESEPSYFRIVSEYIHLNPVRAGMLNKNAPNLASYYWSSYRLFISDLMLPHWLTRRRVFATTDLTAEGVRERRHYRKYMTGKMNEVLGTKTQKEMDEQWRLIRKGWYIGTGPFREELESIADEATEGRKRSSFDSQGLNKHDDRIALEWLCSALKLLGLKIEDCRDLRPSDPKKQAIMWFVRSRTVVPATWLDKNLRIGNPSNLSRAMAAYRGVPLDAERKALKQQFLQFCKD